VAHPKGSKVLRGSVTNGKLALQVRGYLAKKPTIEKHQEANQEHRHGELIDEVHSPQVEIGGAVWVVLTEEITENGTKVKQAFHAHDSSLVVC
jgi:membrane protein implicated in regulation of membrane protease activity